MMWNQKKEMTYRQMNSFKEYSSSAVTWATTTSEHNSISNSLPGECLKDKEKGSKTFFHYAVKVT